MGIRDLEVGKSVVKTRGDHAPDVITMRVHGTVTMLEEAKKYALTWLTIALYAILTYPHTIEYFMLIGRDRHGPRRLMHADTPLLASFQQPLTEPPWINLRCLFIVTYNLHDTVLCPPEPFRRCGLLFLVPIGVRQLCSTCAAF